MTPEMGASMPDIAALPAATPCQRDRASVECKQPSFRRHRKCDKAISTRPVRARSTPSQSFTARLALSCALAVVAWPRAAGQSDASTLGPFCPYLENPGQVFGKEDELVNMQVAWLNAPGTNRAFAGRLWHGSCPSSSCGCNDDEDYAEKILSKPSLAIKPVDGSAKAGNDVPNIRAEFGVQYGRLMMARGYSSCGAKSDIPLVIDIDQGIAFGFDPLDGVEALDERRAFSITSTYVVINCTLQYLTFQGLRFANRLNQLANFGKQPRVTVKVGPGRPGGPTQTGIQFDYTMESSTFIILEEVNSLPNLDTCPTMGLENASGGMLYWHPSMGGDRCMQTLLPGTNGLVTFRDLATPVPLPNNWRQPLPNGAGLQSPVEGSRIFPVRITPPFCQKQDVRISDPPYCETLQKAGHLSCTEDPVSYVYHIEDYDDATLRINGLRMQDKDLWTAHIDTSFSFAFNATAKDISAGSERINDPFNVDRPEALSIQGLGKFSAFCTEPVFDLSKRDAQKNRNQLNSDNQLWDKYCAQSYTDAVSKMVIMDTAETMFHVFPETDRTASTQFDTTNCEMTKATDSARQWENKWFCYYPAVDLELPPCMVVKYVYDQKVCEYRAKKCICKSKVTSSSLTNGKREYEMILFYKLTHRNNISKVFETGYMQLKYTKDTIVGGTMWSDPQTLPYIHYTEGSLPFDWFRASPLKLSGKVHVSDTIKFYVDASTKTLMTPRFIATVSCKYGNVSLPNKPATLLQQFQQNRSHITIVGTLNEINAAFSVVEYRLPGKSILPNFNTLSKKHSIYGQVEEQLAITMDDNGTSGVPSPHGTTTSFDFNVVIVADNDEPEIWGPEKFVNLESTWFPLNETWFRDLDASDRLMPNETIDGPGRMNITEIRLQLSSDYGKFRIDTDTMKGINLLLPVPGSIRPFAGEKEPCVAECGKAQIVTKYVNFTAIKETKCKVCLEDYAKRHIAIHGNSVVMFEGNVNDCYRALTKSWYRGSPGFGRGTPASGDAYTVEGRPLNSGTGTGTSADKASEFIVVTAWDHKNTGCTSTDSKKTTKSFPVTLNEIDDSPFVKFFRNGLDMCDWCRDSLTCDTDCPGGIPKVYSYESTDFVFNESFSTQIRDWDTRSTTFDTATYELRLEVQQGYLILPDSATVKGKMESVSGLTFMKGTKGCTTCKEFKLTGKMYELNKVLIGLKYSPIKHFNSLFGTQEELSLRVTQLTPKPAPGAPAGVPVHFKVIIFVHAVNNIPELDLLGGGKQTTTKLAVKSKFHDFILLGGSIDRSKHCEGTTRTCFFLRDPDACEAMYIEMGIAPAANETLQVQAGFAPTCLNTSLNSGKIKMSVTCTYGDLWFFKADEITTWPMDQAQSPLKDPGKAKKNLLLHQPLSQYLNGVLRYYASPEYSQPDTITMEVEDGGNTGPASPGASKFCCCKDAACSACSAGPCRYDLEVSACSEVPGWSCIDKERTTGWTLPGYGITVIASLAGLLTVGALSIILWRGQVQNTVNARIAGEGVQNPKVAKVSMTKYAEMPENLVAI